MSKKRHPHNYFTWLLFHNKDQELVRRLSKTHDPVKEITEIVGITKAVLENQQLLDVDRSDRETTCYVWGDGGYPFVGSLLAQLTAWRVISIDPNMKTNVGSRVEAFTGLSSEYQYQDTKKALVIGPHSHAPLKDLCLIKSKHVSVCWCPCCFPVTNVIELDSYKDPEILSPHNKIILGRYSE